MASSDSWTVNVLLLASSVISAKNSHDAPASVKSFGAVPWSLSTVVELTPSLIVYGASEARFQVPDHVAETCPRLSTSPFP